MEFSQEFPRFDVDWPAFMARRSGAFEDTDPKWGYMQGYIQADMVNSLYTMSSEYTPPFKPLVVTTTTVVTAPFSHSTSLEESIETWLTDKGYFVEMCGAIRTVSGSHRSRLLSHLRMLGIRIYSIKTEVEVHEVFTTGTGRCC